jgi:hypothetical protein
MMKHEDDPDAASLIASLAIAPRARQQLNEVGQPRGDIGPQHAISGAWDWLHLVIHDC